jgi:hypothetical protein
MVAFLLLTLCNKFVERIKYHFLRFSLILFYITISYSIGFKSRPSGGNSVAHYENSSSRTDWILTLYSSFWSISDFFLFLRYLSWSRTGVQSLL